MLSETLSQKISDLPPNLKDIFIIFADEMEEKSRHISVAGEDFSQLKDIVGELAAAQKRTENRVGELTEAQKRTENRVEELAEAQKRTESRVGELAEAQKRTENRVGELAEAQKRTENRVEELAEGLKELTIAQKRTEKTLKTLTNTVKDMKAQLGGLSMDVGYGLEDKIIPYIFDFGKKEFGVDVGLVDRRNILYPDGRHDEINIYAEGTKGGRPSFIFGECKAQPGKNDVLKFAKVAERLAEVFPGDHYLFMVGYHFHPEVETYIDAMFPRIRIFKSFEFELKYQKRKID